jgi:hypothetical protein
MKRARLSLFWIAFAPALASCAFVLDFDSLQSGGAGGQAGQLLTGGSGGSAGISGGAAGQGSSDDLCGEGSVGLVLDGIDETLDADTYYRVTATGGDDDFFLSSYSLVGGEPVVTLYRIPAEEGALEEIGTLSGTMLGDLGQPASAAGLAFQPGPGLLHAYVALRTLSGDGARVWHTIFNGSTLEMLPVSAVVSESYWQVSPYNYPVATTLGSLVAAAWINEDQTIGLEGAGLQLVETLSAETDAMALAVLATDADEPAVLYGTSDGVFVERPGQEPLLVDECQPAPGAYLSFAATSTTIPGFWIGAWTKFGPETDEHDAFLTSEGLGLYCNAAGCASQARNCDGGAENNLVRNPVTSVIHRQGTTPGLVEVIQARPQLVPGAGEGTVIARLVLTQDAVDFGIPPFENPAEATSLGPEIELSARETSESLDFRGPDWPAIAHVAPDHYLVSWLEPTDEGDALRIQRYRLCLP